MGVELILDAVPERDTRAQGPFREVTFECHISALPQGQLLASLFFLYAAAGEAAVIVITSER